MSLPKVATIQPLELKKRLDEGWEGLILDVREDWEYSQAALPEATHIPLGELVDRMQELAFEDDIVVYCHFGERSHRAALILLEENVPQVANLVGGIDAWSQVVDPSIRRYRPGG